MFNMLKNHDIRRILTNDIKIPGVVEDRISATLSGLGASSNHNAGVLSMDVIPYRTSRTIKKTLLIAAIICTMLIGTVTALALTKEWKEKYELLLSKQKESNSPFTSKL